MDEILTVTPIALEAVRGARAEEPEAEKLALWIEVTGAGVDTYEYDVYFEEEREFGPGDAKTVVEGVPFIVPKPSVDKLRGATLDFSDESGLLLINPNTPPKLEMPEFPPEAIQNELAQQVIAVLADEINPSIASHGGRADLVGVVDEVAYLRLSGGCQGCSLAAVTLSQGIAVAIQERLPEIRDVIDITNHTLGENPYFASEKK